jgi:hypothetical protein
MTSRSVIDPVVLGIVTAGTATTLSTAVCLSSHLGIFLTDGTKIFLRVSARVLNDKIWFTSPLFTDNVKKQRVEPLH